MTLLIVSPLASLGSVDFSPTSLESSGRQEKLCISLSRPKGSLKEEMTAS